MSDPNRLAGSPALGEPAIGLAPVSVVERSPTGIALLGQTLVRIALVVQGLAFAVGGIFTVFLPQPWAITGAAICAGVYAIANTVVGAGPGVRLNPGTQPVTLAAPAAPPSSPTPRVGPPV